MSAYRVKLARCTSLWVSHNHYPDEDLHRCARDDGHEGNHEDRHDNGDSWHWTTDDEDGRITGGGAS